MKWAFLLGSPAISGGTYVIFEHALRNMEKGIDVYIITENKVTLDDISWHNDSKKLKFLTYENAKNIEFDYVIATWWRTVYELPRLKGKCYLYFVQSIESKFYSSNEKAIKWLAEATYLLPLGIITEATWIKEYLSKKYGRDVELVHNGIRKDLYKINSDVFEKKGLRVLVEGPIDVPFKNVPKTIELVERSLADEMWLLTSSEVKEYKGVDKIFSRIPIQDVPKIYRSCDVIVKLSYVEGMFGPPLEMFHCGGTAIAYDVTGHDEYMKNDFNSIIIKTDDEDEVVRALNDLKKSPKKLAKLKENAKKTAKEWIDWETSSKLFGEAVIRFQGKSIEQNTLKNMLNLLFDIYAAYEEKEETLKKHLLRKVQKKAPIVYAVYKKIKNILKKIWRT